MINYYPTMTFEAPDQVEYGLSEKDVDEKAAAYFDIVASAYGLGHSNGKIERSKEDTSGRMVEDVSILKSEKSSKSILSVLRPTEPGEPGFSLMVIPPVRNDRGEIVEHGYFSFNPFGSGNELMNSEEADAAIAKEIPKVLPGYQPSV